MDRARPSAQTGHPAAPDSETYDEQEQAAMRFQQTLACAAKKRPEDRGPALLDTLAILHTLPQSVMPTALRHIITISQDLPEEHAVITTDVLLTHYPAIIAGYGQDHANRAVTGVADTMIICAMSRSQQYQVQLLCKLASVAGQLDVPMFDQFMLQQLTVPLMLPHCHDPASLIEAAALLTKRLPEPQQPDQFRKLYRLANEQNTHRLAALEALQAHSSLLPLTLANVDFVQTLNQEINRLRRGRF